MSVVLHTPVDDLGKSCKVYTCGAASGNLMAGLAVNNITPEPMAHDNVMPAPSAPTPAEFMADFKAPTPGGMG